ncbi:hypothetical protein CWI37_1124p0010 [Hamiltosporidium tvaerminnensis]|uniref:Uncharacterized protein n=1 Tax=Hamiltosporidium tvaerminnensis TaxID=1176355 RepID=A0A4Q9L007_9MICR|nr:hypothetical protein LUQ84_001912 [Hamiltosporidium tvaerminnensis]TBU00061.1 hypothetical protein CWI37_1124p0010 [Hamiltosporidium tvaerminnensis]
MNLCFLLYVSETINSALRPIQKKELKIDFVYEILCKEAYRQYKEKVLGMHIVFEYNFLILEVIPNFVNECDLEVFNYLYREKLENTFLYLTTLIKEKVTAFKIIIELIFEIRDFEIVIFNTRKNCKIHIDSILYFFRKRSNFGILGRFKRQKYVSELISRLLNHLRCTLNLISRSPDIIIVKMISESQYCTNPTLQNFLLSLIVHFNLQISCYHSILITKKGKKEISCKKNLANVLKNAFTSLFYVKYSYYKLEKEEYGSILERFESISNHSLRIGALNITSVGTNISSNKYDINVSALRSWIDKEPRNNIIRHSCIFRSLDLNISIVLIKPEKIKKCKKGPEFNDFQLKLVIKSSSNQNVTFDIDYNRKNNSVSGIACIEDCENFLIDAPVGEKLNFIIRYLNSKLDAHFQTNNYRLFQTEILFQN